MRDYIENGSTIIYQDEDMVIYIDPMDNEHYKYVCTNCGEWYEVDFNKTVNNIRGIEVGNPLSPIKVEYPYKISVTITPCDACGYVHVHKLGDYEEMTGFRAKDATEICKYYDFGEQYSRFKYKIFDAEIIAKYLLGFCHISVYDAQKWFNYLTGCIETGKIMEPCLIAAIICDIVTQDKYSENDLERWYQEGIKYIDDDLMVKVNLLASSML